MTKLIITSIVFFAFFVLLPPTPVTAQHDRIPTQYTRRLPPIDKVELQKVQPGEMSIRAVLASKNLEGAEARRIASLWRTQNFRSFSGMCHDPAYGIKFFSKGKLIMYASLCWACDNIMVQEPTLKGGAVQGFAGRSKMGRKLLEEFTRTFP